MNYFHRNVVWLDSWSKNNWERYPRVCGAIASLSAAVQEEVNHQFWLTKTDRCRKRKRGTVDPSPATGGHGSATGSHVAATGGQGPATGGQDPDTVCHAPAQPSGGHGSATGGHGSATGGQGPATGGQDPDTVFHAQPLRKRRLSVDRRINALRCQLWRKNVKLEQLQQELAKYTRPKDLAKRVSEEWIIRVILTAPNVSARALSESFRMAVGEDHSGRQQPSISRLLVVISRLLVVY